MFRGTKKRKKAAPAFIFAGISRKYYTRQERKALQLHVPEGGGKKKRKGERAKLPRAWSGKVISLIMGRAISRKGKKRSSAPLRERRGKGEKFVFEENFSVIVEGGNPIREGIIRPPPLREQ